MMTGEVIVGSAVGTSIVCTPLPAMLKAIVSVPPLALASVIAWRSDPAPLSVVLVTVYVVAEAAAAPSDNIRTIRAKTRGAYEVMAFPRSFEQPARAGPESYWLGPVSVSKYAAGSRDVSKPLPAQPQGFRPSMHTRSRLLKRLRRSPGCSPCGLIPRPRDLLNGHDGSDRASGPPMTPDAWARVKEILGEAMDLAPGERAAYLDSACAGDGALRTEVESLLTAGGGEWGFFDSPPEVG